MTTQYLSKPAVDDFGLFFSDLKYGAKLAASTEQTLTIPANYKRYKMIVKVATGSDIWVAFNSTATIPAGAMALTDSELNPLCREVRAGDVIHFISSGTPEISIVLYPI